MSQRFMAERPDNSERFAAHLGSDRAGPFCAITDLLEQDAGLPCGIPSENGEDEPAIEPEPFLTFFERLSIDTYALTNAPNPLPREFAR